MAQDGAGDDVGCCRSALQDGGFDDFHAAVLLEALDSCSEPPIL